MKPIFAVLLIAVSVSANAAEPPADVTVPNPADAGQPDSSVADGGGADASTAIPILPQQHDRQFPMVALPSPAPADAGSEKHEAKIVEASPPLPEFIIGKRGYYSASTGYLQLPMPEGTAHFVKLDVNYLYVDQGLAQLYQVHLGMGGKSQVLAVGYGLAFGPRDGRIHLGLKANLGYAHLYEESQDKHVHGLYIGLNPMVMGTLWANWQFFLEVGWSFVPLASQDIPNGRGFTGWNIGVGVGTSLD